MDDEWSQEIVDTDLLAHVSSQEQFTEEEMIIGNDILIPEDQRIAFARKKELDRLADTSVHLHRIIIMAAVEMVSSQTHSPREAADFLTSNNIKTEQLRDLKTTLVVLLTELLNRNKSCFTRSKSLLARSLLTRQNKELPLSSSSIAATKHDQACLSVDAQHKPQSVSPNCAFRAFTKLRDCVMSSPSNQSMSDVESPCVTPEKTDGKSVPPDIFDVLKINPVESHSTSRGRRNHSLALQPGDVQQSDCDTVSAHSHQKDINTADFDISRNSALNSVVIENCSSREVVVHSNAHDLRGVDHIDSAEERLAHKRINSVVDNSACNLVTPPVDTGNNRRTGEPAFQLANNPAATSTGNSAVKPDGTTKKAGCSRNVCKPNNNDSPCRQGPIPAKLLEEWNLTQEDFDYLMAYEQWVVKNYGPENAANVSRAREPCKTRKSAAERSDTSESEISFTSESEFSRTSESDYSSKSESHYSSALENHYSSTSESHYSSASENHYSSKSESHYSSATEERENFRRIDIKPCSLVLMDFRKPYNAHGNDQFTSLFERYQLEAKSQSDSEPSPAQEANAHCSKDNHLNSSPAHHEANAHCSKDNHLNSSPAHHEVNAHCSKDNHLNSSPAHHEVNAHCSKDNHLNSSPPQEANAHCSKDNHLNSSPAHHEVNAHCSKDNHLNSSSLHREANADCSKDNHLNSSPAHHEANAHCSKDNHLNSSPPHREANAHCSKGNHLTSQLSCHGGGTTMMLRTRPKNPVNYNVNDAMKAVAAQQGLFARNPRNHIQRRPPRPLRRLAARSARRLARSSITDCVRDLETDKDNKESGS